MHWARRISPHNMLCRPGFFLQIFLNNKEDFKIWRTKAIKAKIKFQIPNVGVGSVDLSSTNMFIL